MHCFFYRCSFLVPLPHSLTLPCFNIPMLSCCLLSCCPAACCPAGPSLLLPSCFTRARSLPSARSPVRPWTNPPCVSCVDSCCPRAPACLLPRCPPRCPIAGPCPRESARCMPGLAGRVRVCSTWWRGE